MGFFRTPTREQVEGLRERFPSGTRIELIAMHDECSNLMPGDKGTVNFVDDIGTVFVKWDRGSGLGLVNGVDLFKKLDTETQIK